jgi:predicted nuclease of predicted toxin-antitoxin system
LKKPSAASSKSPREPHSIPIFFIDRCLGDRTLADALRARGLPVQIHKDHFAPDARDADWLREVGRRKWVVLTKDKMLLHREIEIRALREAGVRAFILTSGTLKAVDMAEAFVKALPRMQRLLKDMRGGFIARVSRAGAVELIH